MVSDIFHKDKEKLIDSVLNSKILAIIGLEKNTGKTETLNFVVENIKSKRKIGLTSIGTDGEEKDIVFGTLKPSVYVDENFLYTTTEIFFKQKKLLSEIMHVSKQLTPTGRLIVARALEKGKIILSGPQSTHWMQEIVKFLKNETDIVIIDGALSRFSQGNPSIADSIVLATGAAYSIEKREIVKYTRYIYTLCNLPQVDEENRKILEKSQNICVKLNNEWNETELTSVLNIQKIKETIGDDFEAIYIPGALTDNVVKLIKDKEIIVHDFTKIFVTYDSFVKYKPNIKVLAKTNIIGITVNPVSPSGYNLDSEMLINELKQHINDIPIIDVRK